MTPTKQKAVLMLFKVALTFDSVQSCRAVVSFQVSVTIPMTVVAEVLSGDVLL